MIRAVALGLLAAVPLVALASADRTANEGLLHQAFTAVGLTASDDAAPEYRSAAVERGDLVSSVTATGAVSPVATVSVGTEVSGMVSEVYADFNQEVRAGEMIAVIDPTSFEIAVDQAQADLDVAGAAVDTQRSSVGRMRAAVETARHEHRAAQANAESARYLAEAAAAQARRKEALGASGAAAEREDAAAADRAAQANLRSLEAAAAARAALVEMALADLAAAKSQLTSYEAGVRQREAALRHGRIELERTVIRSPVNGVVIMRDIEVGQTVAASLQAPILFTIAQDLREMQVNAAVDESEIGRIVPGQRVEFTVDAFPEVPFAGTVEQIRKSPESEQNVVTYTVVVKTQNPDLLLLPGMTASARFIITESRGVLLVPNAALRFTPPEIVPPVGQHVWVQEEGKLKAIAVESGDTDGSFTEVRGQGLEAGRLVLTAVERRKLEPSMGRLLIGSY